MINTETLKQMEKVSKMTAEELKNALQFDKHEEPKKCSYCGGTKYDPYPNHDTTMRPCPECARH